MRSSSVTTDFGRLERERAVISACAHYRYALYRDLKKDVRYAREGLWPPRPCLFIMLNPSTADGTKDDATIRRCLGFAHRLECDELFVGNLFAWRATDPRDLKKHGIGGGDIVGPENLDWIRALVDVTWRREANRGLVIVAWGPQGTYMQQDQAVLSWIEDEICREGERVYCLGRSKHGAPRHPLMLKGQAKLEDYKL